MLRLSRKLMFAIEAVVDIAYNAADTPVQSKDIATRQNIPRRYLEQVLQQFVREGVLSGVRGPRGGYRLARERRRVTLGQITASWRLWRIRAILLKVRRARCSVAKCCGPSGTNSKTMRSPNSIKSASKTFAVELAIPVLKGRVNR